MATARRLRGARRVDTSAALTALFDRSFAQIAAVAADGRSFDRALICEVSDVWDNNTLPLFAALSGRTAAVRRRRAAAVLAWMAAYGRVRRAWVVEQCAAAGYDVDGVLPDSPDDHAPYRDYAGRVRPVATVLAASLVAQLAADYDASMGRVRMTGFERVGPDERGLVRGWLAVGVSRRYRDDADGDPGAEFVFCFEHVTGFEFDSDAAAAGSAVVMRTMPDGVEIDLGPTGRIAARRATLTIEDVFWHQSAMGTEADRVTPTRKLLADQQPAKPAFGKVSGAYWVAARLVHTAMLEIRVARYDEHLSRGKILALCSVFADAGAPIAEIGAARRGFRREAAARRLVEEWVTRAGPELAPWCVSSLEYAVRDDRHAGPPTKAWALKMAARLRSTTLSGDDQDDASDLAVATVRMIRYSTARTRFAKGPLEAVIHVAAPPVPPHHPDSPWWINVLVFKDVLQFRVRESILTGPCSLRRVTGREGMHGIELRTGTETGVMLTAVVTDDHQGSV